MNKNDKQAGALRTADNKPNVVAMQQELQGACDGAIDRMADQQRDVRTRYCRWSGQQENGRKPDKVGGKPAEPWPGASDQRIRLADELTNDDVVLMKTAARRALLTVRGTEQGDMQRTGKTQVYLDHLRNTRIRRNVETQCELLANWRQTHGYALLAVTWQEEWERVYDVVTLTQLTEASATKGPEAPETLILAALYSPESEVKASLARLLMQLYPDLKRGEAYRQLQALRATGEMSLPRRNLRVNLPQWMALKPWYDVFFPVNLSDPQRAPWIAWRRTFTPEQVREKILGEDWDEEWAKAVVATEGKTILELAERPQATGDRRTNWRDDREEMEGLCEVFYLYYTASGENGVPCKYLTVFSPHVAPGGLGPDHGPDGPLDYEHGKYPFVEVRRDRVEAALVEGRGVPSLSATQQSALKHARDARVDQTDLALRPPLIRPEREVGLPLTIRPRGEIGVRRMEGSKFMTIPQTGPAAEPLEEAARKDAQRYFARNRAEDPVRTAGYEQCLADDWCAELGEAWRMTLQLAQQFESTLVFERIVGGKPVRWEVSRDEIQGQYDLQLYYNTESADPEQMKAKTERLQKVYVPLDRYGILNLAPVVGGLFARDFPEYADMVVQGLEQAGQKEVEDEQGNWSLMIAGEEPMMHEDGQNFGLRLQWLENKIKQPGAQARLSVLPDSAVLVAKRLEHLTFMVQQNVNAATGAVGVEASGPAGV